MKITKNLLNGFYFFILNFLIYFFIGFCFNGNHVYLFILFQSCTALLIYFFENFTSKINSYIYKFSFSIVSIIISLIIIDFTITWSYIIFTPITYYLVTKFKRGNLKIKLGSLFLFLVLYCFISFQFLNAVINLNAERENVKHLTKIRNSFEEITFYDINNKIVDLSKNIIILDFYSNFCGICFEKFPDFDSLSKKSKYQKKDIKFYFVNVLYDNETIEKNLQRFHRYLPENENIVFVKNQKLLENKLMINSYPSVLVVVDGKIGYKSTGIYQKDILNKSLEEIVDIFYFNHF